MYLASDKSHVAKVSASAYGERPKVEVKIGGTDLVMTQTEAIQLATDLLATIESLPATRRDADLGALALDVRNAADALTDALGCGRTVAP